MTCEEFQRQWVLAEGGRNAPAEVGAHLSLCTECQATLGEHGKLQMHLRELAEGETAPETLHRQAEELVREAVPLKRVPLARWIAFAAAILLSFGTILGLRWYFGEGSATPQRLSQELIRDHLRYMPGREQIVSASAQEVERWLQGQVDFPVRVPELPEAALEEGRICSVAGRRTALLHYRRRPDGVLISLFVTQAPQKLEEQETASLVKTAHLGCNAALWYRRGLAYSVVAALNDSTLEQIADSVRQQQP